MGDIDDGVCFEWLVHRWDKKGTAWLLKCLKDGCDFVWRSFSGIAAIVEPGWSPNAVIVWTLIRQGFEELLRNTPTPLVGQRAIYLIRMVRQCSRRSTDGFVVG